MAQVKVIHDPVGQTLTVYWAEPGLEEVCEELGGGVILIKDGQGRVIGFECLSFKPAEGVNQLGVVLQTGAKPK